MKSQSNSHVLVDFFDSLVRKVQLNNQSGLTDINTFLENLFCHLLNIIHDDVKLNNLNLEKINHPAIDLGDLSKRRCFQITSTLTKTKIIKTLARFDKHKLSTKYDPPTVILITCKKSKISGELLLNSVPFDKNKIIDLSDLMKQILALPPEKQSEIVNLLELELNSSTKNNFGTEVQTLIDVVSFLSRNKNLDKTKWKEEPDPEHKIKERFSDHSEYLEKEVVSLIPYYANAKEEVLNTVGLDSVNIEFIRNFLRNKSNSFLLDSKGDPKKALENFTQFIEDKIGISGKVYDSQAIRFYLIDELIKCNVFPN